MVAFCLILLRLFSRSAVNSIAVSFRLLSSVDDATCWKRWRQLILFLFWEIYRIQKELFVHDLLLSDDIPCFICWSRRILMVKTHPSSVRRVAVYGLAGLQFLFSGYLKSLFLITGCLIWTAGGGCNPTAIHPVRALFLTGQCPLHLPEEHWLWLNGAEIVLKSPVSQSVLTYWFSGLKGMMR